MKKLTIMSLAALTVAFGLGLSLPTYATTNQATPTYNDINRAVSQLKGSGQYYEYSALIQDINSGRTYRLSTDILAIDSTLNLSNKTNAELVNIAKSLPNYDLYVYLYNLVDYTESWMPNYYSANTNTKQEAYDAVNDAVIACKYLLSSTPVAKTNASSSISRNADSAKAPAQQADTSTIQSTEKATPANISSTANVATDRVSTVAELQTTPVAEPAKATEAKPTTTTSGTTISVTVLPREDEGENELLTTSTDTTAEDTAATPIVTNFTYAATATSLAGAVLATKRELKAKTRRF